MKWEAASCHQGLEGTLADTSTGERERKILDSSADKHPLRKQLAGGAGPVMRHDPLQHPEQRQAVTPLRVPPRLSEPIHTQPGNTQEAAAAHLPGSRLTCCAGQDPARGLILKAQSRAVLELLPSRVLALGTCPALQAASLGLDTALSSRPAAAAWLLSPTHPKLVLPPHDDSSSAPLPEPAANFWLDHRLLWPPPSDPSTETACPRARHILLGALLPTEGAMLSEAWSESVCSGGEQT